MEQRPACPKCESANIYVRVKTGEIVCLRCGAISPRKETEAK